VAGGGGHQYGGRDRGECLGLVLHATRTSGCDAFLNSSPAASSRSQSRGRPPNRDSPISRWVQLVFAAQGRLYLRALSDAELRPIRGSESHQLATSPVFSPDGRFVVFWALSDRTLKRIPVTGGSAETICAAENPFGIDWAGDQILFGQDGKGILRVAPSGGTPAPVVTVGDGEQADSPQLLPGGTHVMFTLANGTARDRWDQARVVAQSLASGQRKILLTGGSHARYVATGHLIYAVSGTLFARPFDLRRLEVTGDALPVIVGIGRSIGGTTGVAQFSVSDSGSLAYVAGPLSVLDGAASHLALIDRRGLVEPLKMPAGVYVSPRASPDGSRIAFGTDNGKEAIVWTYELSGSRAMQQLTTVGNNRFPIWTSDSTRIVFQSDREGDLGLFWQPADGTGNAERLTRAAPGEAHIPDSWSPTSNTLIFSVATGSAATSRRYSLATLSLPDRTMAAYDGVQSADPPGAVFSPDGRWVAYSRTEASKTTVYVQPFPATGAPPFTLPARGFDTPHAAIWSPNGKELFYTSRPSDFEAVSVTTQPSFMFGAPSAVPSPFRLIPPYGRRSYDITSHGRFLASVAAPSQGSDTGPAPEVQVVLNWFRELRERVPLGR
jgi:WD40-like Beta Propeller Repeat